MPISRRPILLPAPAAQADGPTPAQADGTFAAQRPQPQDAALEAFKASAAGIVVAGLAAIRTPALLRSAGESDPKHGPPRHRRGDGKAEPRAYRRRWRSTAFFGSGFSLWRPRWTARRRRAPWGRGCPTPNRTSSSRRFGATALGTSRSCGTARWSRTRSRAAKWSTGTVTAPSSPPRAFAVSAASPRSTSAT